MIDLDNQTGLLVNISMLEKIASSLSNRDIEVIIMDEDNIQTLNHQYRNKNSHTDVLSFPLDTSFTQQVPTGLPLGSIVICDSYVKENSIKFGHSNQDELSLLFIHGILHLLGFNHEADNGEMRQKEVALIEAFGLPKSLIVRTQKD